MLVLVFLERKVNKLQGVLIMRLGSSNSLNLWCLHMVEKHTEEILLSCFTHSTRISYMWQHNFTLDFGQDLLDKHCMNHSFTNFIISLWRHYHVCTLVSSIGNTRKSLKNKTKVTKSISYVIHLCILLVSSKDATINRCLWSGSYMDLDSH